MSFLFESYVPISEYKKLVVKINEQCEAINILNIENTNMNEDIDELYKKYDELSNFTNNFVNLIVKKEIVTSDDIFCLRYTNLIKCFDKMTKKQINNMIPNMDKNNSLKSNNTKKYLISCLLTSLKRKCLDKNEEDFISLYDNRFKFPSYIKDDLYENNDLYISEWDELIKDENM